MSSISKSEKSQQRLCSFPIIGIGASAGGLEAFSQLLRAIPTDIGMAFVLIQHLDPVHSSHLSEILSRTTQMSVNEVQDGMAIAPNCVYVIPPNTEMTLSQGRLKLSPRKLVNGRYMAINTFLSSLAAEQGNQAIAIILSGSNQDGTIGLSDVKEGGGITFAQDPKSSEFPFMPQSAITSGYVDLVLSAADIAAELIKISHHPYVMTPNNEENKELNAELKLSESLDKMTTPLSHILEILKSAVGVDFSQYKEGTLTRRIMR